MSQPVTLPPAQVCTAPGCETRIVKPLVKRPGRPRTRCTKHRRVQR